MHLDTGYCNVSSAATEWHGTTQNLSFRPEIVDWACSLWQNKKWFQRHKLVHLMHPILIFTMGQVRQRNGVKIPKMWVLDQMECIEIFQVVCLESYYSETFNQMYADTSFRNGSGASTIWRETFENMSFGPKVVDWACSLLENKKRKRFWRHKLMH